MCGFMQTYGRSAYAQTVYAIYSVETRRFKEEIGYETLWEAMEAPEAVPFGYAAAASCEHIISARYYC